MANKKLENKTFVIPDHVIKTVKPGTMRSDFVIRRKDDFSYYNMKRLKNFFDTKRDKDPKTYNALGEDLRKWLERTLNINRDSMYKGKKIKSDIGMLNVFKKAHNKDKSRGNLGVRIPKPNTNARQMFTGKGLYENIDIDDIVANTYYKSINRDLNFSMVSLPYKYDNSFFIDIIVDDEDEFSLIFKNGNVYQEMYGEKFAINNYKDFLGYVKSQFPDTLKNIRPERAPKLKIQKGVYESIIKKIIAEIKNNSNKNKK